MRNPRTVFSLLLAVTLLPAFLSGQARPKVTLNPTLSPPKSPVLASGKNFLPGAHIIASLDTQQIGEALADASGGFKNARINIPSGIPEGRHTMAFIDISNPQGYTVTLPFTIQTNWPQRHFDAQNTANNPYEWKIDTNTVKALAPVWNTVGKPQACMFNRAYTFDPAAIVMGGVVYYSNDAVGLQALDAATGSFLWGFDTTGTGSGNCGGEPVGDNRHTVMLGNTVGTVWAINTLTHGAAWFHPGFPFNNNGDEFAMLSAGTSLFVVIPSDGSLTSLGEANGGVTNWSLSLGSDSVGLPAWNKGRVFPFAYSDALAYNATTASLIWQTPVPNQCCAYNPVAGANTVYYTAEAVSLSNSSISAFDATKGKKLWTTSVVGRVQTAPALANGLFYTANTLALNGELLAIMALDKFGASPWVNFLGLTVTSFSSPIVANGVVYVGIANGKNSVVALDGSDGTLLWSFDFPGGYGRPSPLAVVDGTLYVGAPTPGGNSDIFAFR